VEKGEKACPLAGREAGGRFVWHSTRLQTKKEKLFHLTRGKKTQGKDGAVKTKGERTVEST